MSNVVTRFAPSPTGYLHVGGARTALFSWLLARNTGGKFLLRIEDTDLARSTEEAVHQLVEDLQWLGLKWDNAVLMFQSKRLEIYNKLIDDLIARGQAYKAYETSEELDAQRKIAEREKRSYSYRRTKLTDEQMRQYESENRPHVVRFVMPVQEYRFNDVVLGKDIVQPANECQDFVIRKTDGMPTYHFGVVVDDAEMGITHVLRGQEHTKNTFYHIALQHALGYARPIYGHLPIILNTDGNKMGKRDRDKKVRERTEIWLRQQKKTSADLSHSTGIDAAKIDGWIGNKESQLSSSEHRQIMPAVGLKESDLPEILVHDFRRNGYLPEVLLNFLALLGWSPGGDKEQMSMEELVRLFAIDGIGKSNAKFSRDKLLAFNTDACAVADSQRLLDAMKQMLATDLESPLHAATDAQLMRLIQMKKGFRTLREVEEICTFFFTADDKIAYDASAVDKVLKKNEGQGTTALRDLRTILANAQEWNAHAIETLLNQYCAEKSLQLGKVAQPLRVAISGTTVSPPIFESLEFLGKDKTIARIDRCLSAAA